LLQVLPRSVVVVVIYIYIYIYKTKKLTDIDFSPAVGDSKSQN